MALDSQTLTSLRGKDVANLEDRVDGKALLVVLRQST